MVFVNMFLNKIRETNHKVSDLLLLQNKKIYTHTTIQYVTEQSMFQTLRKLPHALYRDF